MLTNDPNKKIVANRVPDPSIKNIDFYRIRIRYPVERIRGSGESVSKRHGSGRLVVNTVKPSLTDR
jgi:hypothetical protein